MHTGASMPAASNVRAVVSTDAVHSASPSQRNGGPARNPEGRTSGLQVDAGALGTILDSC